MILRIRQGHNRLNAHIFRKMKLAPSPTCNFGLEDQTAEHMLQRCPLLQTTRKNMLPTAVRLDTKLCGIKEEVGKKATFIFQTGPSVQRQPRRKREREKRSIAQRLIPPLFLDAFFSRASRSRPSSVTKKRPYLLSHTTANCLFSGSNCHANVG